jgi:hypothetical protein
MIHSYYPAIPQYVDVNVHSMNKVLIAVRVPGPFLGNCFFPSLPFSLYIFEQENPAHGTVISRHMLPFIILLVKAYYYICL